MLENLDWLDKRAQLSEEKVAVISADEQKSWSYGELNKRAIQLANYFIKRGVNKGDRIAFIAPNSIYYFDFLFACSKIGAIFVPLNWRLAKLEINAILVDCQPRMIVIHEKFYNQFKIKFNVETFPIIKKEYENLLSEQNNALLSFRKIVSDDPVAIFYTGGTTGKPKGVVLSFQSVQWNAINTVISWGLASTDVTLTCMPLFHTGGMNALTIPILMCGGKVVVSEKFEAEQAIHDLNHYQVTIVLFVPTMYEALVHTESFKKAQFPHIRTFLSGGAPCPLPIYKKFAKKGFPFKEGYGLTEAGPNNFTIDPEEALMKRGSVGRPMLFNEVKVINKEGQIAERDEVGELLIRGKHVFSYYWNNNTETSLALQEGWLHTGDLAMVDKDGYYFIVGRKKDLIITGGENVFPQEVERVLHQHPKIEEVTVMGVDDEKWGEVVITFIVLRGNNVLTTDEIDDYCSQKLARYKVPKRIVFLDRLPKTDVGKIDKQRLKEYFATMEANETRETMVGYKIDNESK